MMLLRIDDGKHVNVCTKGLQFSKESLENTRASGRIAREVGNRCRREIFEMHDYLFP